PNKHQCVLYDDRLEEIPFDDHTDLVVLTVETFTAKRSYEISQIYRNKKIPVVMGGFHPSLLAEEASMYADAIVIGDAEGIWPTIIEDAENKRLQSKYQQNEWPSIKGVIPDRSIFKGKKYSPLHLVQFGRGCRYSCDFCSINSFYGKSLRQRNIEDVVTEIKNLKRKNLFFVDDNIFVDLQKAVNLLEALIPLKVRWSCQISIDVTKNESLMKLMKKSGCYAAIVGLETLNANNLKMMNKNWSKQYDYELALNKFKSYGIMVLGTFVIGYDHDTLETFDQILNFTIKNKLFLAHFNPLTPTPQTPLYERLKNEGRLINDPWWLHPDYRYGQAMFKPKNISPLELEENCYRVRTAFNTYSSIAIRAWDFKANFAGVFNAFLYLLANLITKRELKKKQGCHLGK
ncbi:MAG: B12-binding domain-containing radical SAM protein, partial [Oligoflexia bacterium]|nr:B12-binding domain-containing radical SAM protein [Oligoflexia bacterium]